MNTKNEPILLAQNNGFTLPAPGAGAATTPAAMPSTSSTQAPATIPGITIETGTGGSKSMLIGAGLVLLVAIIAFFIRGAYSNSLVAKKIAPSSANAAGWWMFLLIVSLLGGAAFGLVNQGIFTVVYMAALGVFALFALVMMIVSSNKK